MESNEVAECSQTFEQVKKELENIESKLALKHNLTLEHCRLSLIALDEAGLLNTYLEEDELVADWREIYQSYLNYFYSAGKELFDGSRKIDG